MDNNYERRLVDHAGKEYHLTDRDGNLSKYRLHEGHKFVPKHFPANTGERLEAIASMPCRNNDILLSVYPKSGTHWLTNIVTMVVRGDTDYAGTPLLLEFADLEKFKRMESPRILASHLPFKYFPKGIKEGKGKVITVNRNPKDVMVSYFCFCAKLYEDSKVYDGDWNGFVKFYLDKEVAFDSWFDHVKMWDAVRKSYPEKEILFLSYEGMKKNLFQNVMKISRFLNIERSETFCKEVSTKCIFSNMQRDVNKSRDVDEQWTNTAKNGHLPIYRKGEIGDWKNWFTVAQNEIFDKVYKRELDGHDISYVYQHSEA